jgi:hypothetical protein
MATNREMLQHFTVIMRNTLASRKRSCFQNRLPNNKLISIDLKTHMGNYVLLRKEYLTEQDYPYPFRDKASSLPGNAKKLQYVIIS